MTITTARAPRSSPVGTRPDLLPSPWGETAAAYDRITIAGVVFEGEFDDDFEGSLWKKKNDHRSGRGRNGGRTVATGWDLADFTVTLYAHDEVTFAALQAIMKRVLVRSPARQDATAIMVDHPVLLAADIKQATLDEAGFGRPKAGGKASLKLKLKEFHPAPPASAVRAPGAAAQGESRTVSTVARGENGQPVSYGPPTPITMVPIPPPPPPSGPNSGPGADGFGAGPGA